MGEIVDMFSRKRIDGDALHDYEGTNEKIAKYGTYVGKLPKEKALYIRHSGEELRRIDALINSLQEQWDDLYEPHVESLKEAFGMLKLTPKPHTEPYIDDNGDVWLVEHKNLMVFLDEIDKLRKDE